MPPSPDPYELDLGGCDWMGEGWKVLDLGKFVDLRRAIYIMCNVYLIACKGKTCF